MSNEQPAFDWKKPDYGPVYAQRMEWIKRLREDPARLAGAKVFYKTHPVEFITEWGMTFDPRNAEVGLPATMPFVLFPKQEEFIDWIYARWTGREDGLAEKSRDMGVSWLCVGFAVWMFLFHPGTVAGFGSRKEEYVDKAGDPKSLFWKARMFINALPPEFRPQGWNDRKHAPHMLITNPENGSTIVGEAGDNIGRGARTSIYFKDESAFYERADGIEAALSQTSNCKLDISTPNGVGNAFYRKRHSGKVPVFVFDWRDDPRKGEAWYAKQQRDLEPSILAQEVDRSYSASIQNSWISEELVTRAAQLGPADIEAKGPLMVGVDCARFGDDKTVITFRRGRVLLRQVVAAKLPVTAVANLVISEVESYREEPGQIAVDAIGIGAGVADILRGKWPDEVVDGRTYRVVVDVNVAVKLADGQNYNVRAKVWRDLKEWLEHASIPNDNDLKAELSSLRYSYRAGELLIESKEDAKKRGIKSPDRADSLTMTFAVPPMKRVRAKINVPRRQMTNRRAGY